MLTPGPSGKDSIPLVILAGSDRRAGPVPAEASNLHFVVGYKGACLRFGGRPLAQVLVERARKSKAFGEVYLSGPARVYQELVDCPVIDTDGHVGQNIRAAVNLVRERHGRRARLAFMACDILPEAEEIAELADQLTRLSAPGEEIPALALSFIAAEAPLGASSWKPKYRIRTGPNAESHILLPGHLAVAWPARLRMGLLYRLLDLFYRERNKDYDQRRRAIIARILLTLLGRDFFNLIRLKPPTLTYTVLRHGLGTFMRWRRNQLDLEGLAHGCAAIIVRRRYFRRWRSRCVRIATTPLLSFAKDIDTEEELGEVAEKLKDEAPR